MLLFYLAHTKCIVLYKVETHELIRKQVLYTVHKKVHHVISFCNNNNIYLC